MSISNPSNIDDISAFTVAIIIYVCNQQYKSTKHLFKILIFLHIKEIIAHFLTQ